MGRAEQQKEIWVAVGDLVVSGDPQMCLAASTSSCLALTAWSPSPAVGALAHVAMPYSNGIPVNPDRPAFYADHAVVCLLGRLARMGIGTDRLELSLVGGGQVAATRIGSDVGRRNVESLRQALARRGLQIGRSEILGRLGRRVLLSVASGKLEVTPSPGIGHLLGQRSAGWNPPRRMVDLVAETVESINGSPQAAGQVIRLCKAEPIDWKTVLQWLAADPILAIQMLRLCNSTSYGRCGQVATVWQGRQVLGDDAFRRACMLAATARPGALALRQLGLHLPDLARHARQTAATARTAAGQSGPDRLGQVIFASLVHPLRAICWAIAQSPDGPGSGDYQPASPSSRDAHCRLWGRLTAALLGRWNVPAQIIPAIAGPGSQTPNTPSEAIALAEIVHQACRQHPGADCGRQAPEVAEA